ncbi:aspartate/glutamate racemase family protein [Nitratireductor sp. PBL-C9]|uniref:arylmalonate decarboxylase n=1 Tax=Nitratireductor sp. PBL-C9 TaxID=3435013 RepID=UPI003D7C8481
MGGKPVIGMIVPPAAGAVPPEPLALYAGRAEFIAEGLALKALSPEGYDAVIERVEELSARLAERGAQAISLMGTSLSFYRGAAFNAELIATMEKASGLPATTMTDSVLEAFAALGVRRLAVATAYRSAVNDRLKAYLEAAGFEVTVLRSLDIEDVDAIASVTSETLIDLGAETCRAAKDAEALFISCGGLQTLPVTEPVEQRCGLPVVSSALAGAWGAMGLLGLDRRADGAGRLFQV